MMRFSWISLRSHFLYLHSATLIHKAKTSSSSSLIFLQSHSLHSNPNNDPKKPYIPSLSNPNAQLQQLLYEKSKVGFDKLDNALLLFDKMLKMKPLLPVINFNQLLAGLVRMKEYSVCASMFRDMCAFTIPVNIVTFTTVINCFRHLNKIDYAFSLLGGIIKRGFLPNVVTYNTLIKGLLSQDRPVEAEHLFKNLIKFNEVQPNVVSYNIIIDGLCKTSNTSMAVKLFRNMDKKGCIPNTVTYNTIIGSLCKDRHVDHAMNLLSEMNHKGVSPNVVTCSIILHGLCHNHLLGEALSFFQTMKCAGILPNIYIYTILIDGLGKDGHLEKARTLFERLPSKGLRPNVKTYTVMIGAFCREGLLDEANELFAEMKDSNCLPNDATYNTLRQFSPQEV